MINFENAKAAGEPVKSVEHGADHQQRLADQLKSADGVASALSRLNGALAAGSTEQSEEPDEFDENGSIVLGPSFQKLSEMNNKRADFRAGRNWNQNMQEAQTAEDLEQIIEDGEKSLVRLNSSLNEQDPDGAAFEASFNAAKAAAQKVYDKSPSKGDIQWDARKDELDPESPASKIPISELIKGARENKAALQEGLPKAKERLVQMRKAEELAATEEKNTQEKEAGEAQKAAFENLRTLKEEFSDLLARSDVEANEMKALINYADEHRTGEGRDTIKLVYGSQGQIEGYKAGFYNGNQESKPIKQQILDRKQELVAQLTSKHAEVVGALEKFKSLGSQVSVDDETKYLAGNPQAQILARLEKIV